VLYSNDKNRISFHKQKQQVEVTSAGLSLKEFRKILVSYGNTCTASKCIYIFL